MKKPLWLLVMAGLVLTACGLGKPSGPLPTGTPIAVKAVAPQDLAPLPSDFPRIQRHPDPWDWQRGKITEVKDFDFKSYDIAFGNWQMDYRSFDVSALDLRLSIDRLAYISFDSKTAWPAADKISAEYDRQRILELGKNPGPGVRQLHTLGVTGRGIGIAIIDNTMLADHSEYVDQLRLYEEVGDMPDGWAYDTSVNAYGPGRATAQASLLVGKTTGLAPEADLYSIAIPYCLDADNILHLNCLAQGITRVLAINQELPAGRKIQILVIPFKFKLGDIDYPLVADAIKQATAAGITVFYPRIAQFKYLGMGRFPLDDSERFESYGPGMLDADGYFANVSGTFYNQLYIPMDSRTLASPTGVDDYVFVRQGSDAECASFLAGAYALALQVKPDLKPDDFWALALKTGVDFKINRNFKDYKFGLVFNLPGLIQALQEGK